MYAVLYEHIGMLSKKQAKNPTAQTKEMIDEIGFQGLWVTE